MVNKRKKKFTVNGELLRKFRSALNKSQEEIVSQMNADGSKIGLRKYKEAEQGKKMSLDIISTIARWYQSMNISTNIQIHNENINAETISEYTFFDDYGLEVFKSPIIDRIKKYPAQEQIPAYQIKDPKKFFKIITNSSKRKIIFNITPTTRQRQLIDEFIIFIDEVKKKNLSLNKPDDDDNYGSEVSTAYLSVFENCNKLIKGLEISGIECYVSLYQKPVLDIEPVDAAKLTFHTPYTQGDFEDGLVPEEYEPEPYGAYKTKLNTTFYAFFVFDKPYKQIEINYENNFSATLIKDLIEEDNYTQTGVISSCLSKMIEYYGKKYGYNSKISTSKLEITEGDPYLKYETGEDWLAGIHEAADDVIELLLNDSRLKNFAVYDDTVGNYNFEVREGREKWYKDNSKSHDYLREIVEALLQHDNKIPKVVNLILTAGETLKKALDKIPELDPNYYDHIG